jgi:hypothetical protein
MPIRSEHLLATRTGCALVAAVIGLLTGVLRLVGHAALAAGWSRLASVSIARGVTDGATMMMALSSA